MALENDGVARRIYEESDADLQLQGFYEEVATPLLINVQLNYIGAANLTHTSFKQFYNGSEIVVAGQITDNNLETLQTEVIAIAKNTNVTYQDSVSIKDVIDVLPQHENFIQRLWAYLTVKQLLEKEMTLKGDEKEAAKKTALDLSLKHEFVTPLTSIVVTKPQEEQIQVAHKPKEGKRTSSIRQRITSSPCCTDECQPHGIDSLDPDYRDACLSGEHGFYATKPSRPRHRKPSTKKAQKTKSPPAASNVRFLISALPKPICYDTPVDHKLLLLSDASSEFSMNGQLTERGFRRIAFRFKTANLLVSHDESVYSEGQNIVKFTWGQSEPSSHESDDVSIFQRTDELDVTVGSVRVVIRLHKKAGYVFLWPVVHQLPTSANVQGILGKTDLQYKELPGPKIKIKDLEVEALWSSAIDYRFPTAPTVECWLVPLHSALQGELSDFTVSQL